jgi:hypothetical protein
VEELHLRDPGLRIHAEPWDGDDPTDHVQLFDFLREKLPAMRRKFADINPTRISGRKRLRTALNALRKTQALRLI